MEDDGLLLNFAVPDASTKHVERATGGRWKDRRKLNLALQGRGRTSTKSKNQTGVNSIEVKDSKLDSDAHKRAGPRPPQASAHAKFLEARGEFGGKNNSYVSSLFTSNQESQLAETKQEHQQTYLPSNAPVKDAMTFEELGLNETLSSHMKNTLRFKTPTRVQRSAIPSLILARTDLFIKAQTGSGKTLAFVLPIVHKLMQENTHKITRDSGVFAMILAPTRELATQIYGVLETVTRCNHHIVPGIVIGGEKKKSEKARIRKGVNILVGTPGRLADHIENTEALDLSQLRYLILDEGDRLIELGFEETITKITQQIASCSKITETANKWQGLPQKRLNVLCSATMQNNVEKLGSLLLDKPEMISVDSKKTLDGAVDFDDDSHLTSSKGMSAPDQLVQKVVVVPSKLRLVTLNAILKQIAVERTMVFFSCSDSVNYHFDVFTRDGKGLTRTKNEETGKLEIKQGFPSEDSSYSVMTSPLLGDNTVVYKLHGSMSQQERTSTLSMFVNDSSSNSVLFCTDVASRGLDLPKISEVIEYDPPFTIEDHLHRIGRTARVGNEGSAYMFLLPGLEEGYKEAKLALVHAAGSLRVEGYEELLKTGYGEVVEGKKTTKWDIHATTWHLNLERRLLEDKAMHDKASLAFTSHVRAYATHLSSERNFFNVKQLHFGHLAKSFGLRDNPKKLGRSAGDFEEPGKKRKKMDPKQKMLKMAKMAVKATSNEFNY